MFKSKRIVELEAQVADLVHDNQTHAMARDRQARQIEQLERKVQVLQSRKLEAVAQPDRVIIREAKQPHSDFEQMAKHIRSSIPEDLHA